MPDELPIGGQVTLSPDQIAQITPALPVGGQVRLNPEQASQARKDSGQFDPLQDFSPEQLAELQKQSPDFSILHEYAARPDLQEQFGMNQKIADAYHLGRVNGSWLDKYRGESGLGTTGNVVKGAAKTVWETAKGFGKQAWNYAQALATPVGAAVTAPFTTPETTEGMFSQAQRQVAENIAGSESSLLGLGKTVAAGAGMINRKLGIEKPLADYTPEEKQSVLFDQLRDIKKQQAIATGQGPVLGAVGSEVVQSLKEQGLPVRPEEVQELAAGDPFSWYAMGRAFHAAGAAVPAAVTARAARLAEVAGNAAAKVGGKTVETAADVARLGATAAAKIAPVTGAAVGAIKGAELHGPAGLVVGAGAGLKAGQKLAEGLGKVSEKLGNLSEVGEQIAGTKPMVSPIAQLGKDILQAAPAAAGELAKGAAFDAGLIAATSEESPDEKAGIGFGTVFGALGAAKRIGGHVLSGQIIAPREYGATAVIPSSKAFPVLDAMHDDAVKNSTPGVVTRINAIRSFVKGTAPGTDVFLAKDIPSLEAALKQTGFTDEQAKLYASQKGFFTASVTDKSGTKRPIIVARDIAAAPHEAYHAIQDVLGEDANREIDKLVYDAYKDQWDQQGRIYARRLPQFDPNKTWQENIVDLSGLGRAEAAEKMARDAYNTLSEQQGGEPSAADVHQMASAAWDKVVAEAAKNNPGVPLDKVSENAWRDVLSPEEANAVANRYIARELAAENFDAAFKHGTAGNEKLVPRLANIVGNVVSALGGEPLAGRESELGGVPLKFDITKKVGEVLPKTEVLPASEKAVPSENVRKASGMPRTVEEQQQAAQDARDLAAAAPEQAPTTGTGANLPATKSPREILGAIAEAIAQRTGIKINYLSAPDEPAAATTSKRGQRRAIIEAFRTMPTAARALWEKTFFPERVVPIGKGKLQVLGWAPEVFASNAHKLAQTLADLKGTVNSPYEIDPKNRTFTEKGWRDLFDDVQNFVKNQTAGKTGAGEKLVVPQETIERGFYNPPVEGRPGAALDQRRADFINLLFNIKLQETPRIMSGKFPPNLAGQAVSEATKPGRVTVPVRPRGKFEGPAAQKLGIEGEQVMEVNPVRAEIEAAAQKAGLPMPDMIEAVQRLALEHINDVQAAPEAPQFRGNTLTLTAGFQPSGDPRAIKAAAVRERKTGRVFEGRAHFDAQYKAIDAGLSRQASDYDDGFTTNSGEFLDRDQALKRATELKQLEPGARVDEGESLHSGDVQFQPPAEAMETLKSDKGGDLKDYKGKFASGGTGWAYDVGSRARTLDDLKAFRSAREVLTEAGTAAMKAKDYTKAMDLLTRAQFAREAYEWATGVKMDNNAEEGSAETVRQNKPDSAPPIPGGEAGKAPVVPGELHHGQFSPSENPRAIRTAAIEDEKGNRFEGPMHLLAYSKALEAGFAAQDLGNFTEGFLTNDGKFLNRKQAFDRAQELGQIKTEFAGRTTLTSEHMRAEGSPELKGQFAPNEDLQEVAGDYAQGNDELKYERTGAAVPVPTDTAKKIADFYQAAKHSPDDPEVRRSYSALNNETGSQYDALVNAGYKIEPWTKEGEPYANSEAMMADVRDNKHLFYRPTNADLTDKSNRMLDPVIGMKGTPINDIFRAVHDIFGHAKEGYGFGPKGEFNAWRAHSAMYSEDAQGALAAETLGQNSWVNYGEHLRNEQGNVPVKGEPGFKGLTERPFAEQKNIVLPPELMAEAKGQFQPGEEKPEDELKVARQFWVDSKGVTHPAYGGHMEEAYKIFPKTKTEAEGEISKIYPMMFQKGNVRGLYRLAPDPYLDLVGNGWSTLSTATQSEIKRISQSLNIPVEYNGRPIETGVEPLQKREAQFSPGKNKEDWEFKKSPGTAFSKAWILPNGVPWQLGGQWHHEALNENPDIAKKYGISATDSSEENRVDALKKGFARVNMGMHNGLLTIEARAADWRKLKPSVERMVDENLNSIDKITVNLMNPKVDKVVDSRTGVLFDKDTPAEKMENIPFVTLGEVRGQFQPGKPGADRDRPVFDERSLRKAISSVYPVRSTDQWGTREAIEQPKLTTELVEQLKREFPNVSEDSIRDNIDSAFGRNGWNVEPTEAEALFKKIAPLFRAQFAPSFEHKDFESELEKIRSGKSGGQTFTTSGAVWTPKNPKVDIVSLASVNVPQGDLTKENFLDAVAPYEALLGEHPNLVAGAFSFSKEGIPTVSIDINAVVPQKFRANTLKFAKDNEQRAIWNVDKGENIDAGGNGNTRLNSPEEILDAVDPLLRGKSVSVDDILKQNTAGELPGEQGTFEGIGTKEPISSAALGSLTKAELAKQYPEAVIARRRGEPIDSNIKSSPLAKEAGSEEAAIDAFARRLVEFSKEYQNDPIFKSGAKWYEDFVPQLKKEFGEHAQLMAELLAATSPRTDVASNYAYALDALEGFKSGRFKKTIAKFEEGLKKFEDDTWHSWYNKELKAGNIPNPPKEPTPAAFMAQWIYKNNLKPTQSNGKLYGTHSIRLLQVFARRWNDLNTGPKTRTFVSNLLGTGHDATIDVWADRTMRRLGYAGFEDRWRILPQNAAPVSDEDFYFSQKAFAKAAKELGMKPDALQGALWFAEKDHWAKNGWARLDLGSFQTELEKTAMLKQGIQQRSAVSKADQKAKTAEPLELGISVEPRNIKK